MTRASRPQLGFSLLEILIATAVAGLVLAVAFRLLDQTQAAWRADAARAELQQRGRVAADTLTHLLRDAGGGVGAGPVAGPLLRFIPPIIPRRVGRRGADAAATVRSDAFTTLSVLAEAEPGELLLPAPAGATDIVLAPTSGCARPPCGFSAGAAVMLADTAGNHDIFTILTVVDTALTLRHHGDGSQTAYPSGSPVLPVVVIATFLDRAARTLRRSDGDASDLPHLDDVVDLRVEYFGTRQPPRFPKPPIGSSNCLYDTDGAYRMPLLPVPAAPDPSLMPVPATSFTDGPWCGRGGMMFDVDLLRVRRVRVSVRLQATDPAVRGTDVGEFRVPGSAAFAGAMVPDLSVVADVAPRNLRTVW